MNLPNKLTMMRVIMVPFFMVFAAMSHMGTPQFNATYALIAGILFAVASFTDFLDGYLARKNHLVTDFGKFMDPLADKMLTTAAIIYMVVDGVCSPRGAGHHHVPRVCCGRCAHDCGRVRYRHCRKHVGQGQKPCCRWSPSSSITLPWRSPRRTALGLSALPPRCCAGPLLPLPHFPAASTCGRIVPALCRQNDAAPLQPLIRAAIINLNGLQV